MLKNTASQKWIIFAFNLTTNAPVTGNAASITSDIIIDGVSSTIAGNPTEIERGYYSFALSQANTNGDQLTIIPVSSTSGVQVIGVPGSVWTFTNVSPPTAAVIADAIWDEAQSGHTSAGTYGLGFSSPSVSAIADGVWDEARSGHTSTGTYGQGVASVQGNVVGSVGSVTGSVASVAGGVGGNVTGSVASVLGNVIGSVNSVTNVVSANLTQINAHAIPGIGTRIADGLEYFFNVETPSKTMNEVGIGEIAKDWTDTERQQIRYRLGVDGVASASSTNPTMEVDLTDATVNTLVSQMSDSTTIINGVFNTVVEGSWTFIKVLRILNAYMVGRTTGSGTSSITFTDIDHTKERIDATIDEDGNRIAVVLDGD